MISPESERDINRGYKEKERKQNRVRKEKKNTKHTLQCRMRWLEQDLGAHKDCLFPDRVTEMAATPYVVFPPTSS